MIIKCHNCGHENLLGAIFCRNCGEKLDIEKMRPEIQKSGKRDGGLFGVIRRLIGILVLLGLIGIGVGIFLPETSDAPSLSADDQKAAADKKFQEFMQRIDEGFGKDEYVFSISEINYLYNSKFITSDGANQDTGAYNIDSFYISVDPLGYLNFYLKTKFAGKITTTFEIKAAFSGDTQPISAIIVEAKMGKIPIKFLENKIAEKFAPVLSDGRVKKILDSIKKAEITEDRQFSVSLKEKVL